MTNESENTSGNSTKSQANSVHEETIQDRLKTASNDAMSAFKMFALNPVGDLSTAFEALGTDRALKVGIVFGVMFALMFTISVRMMMPPYFLQFLTFGGYIKVIFAAFVPFIGLAGGNYIARLVCRGQGSLSHDSFIAGASLLPLGILVLLSSIIGIGNIEVIALLSIFASCLTILMLFAGQTRICKTSERLATISVPLILLASVWLSKIIWVSFSKDFTNFH